jgi:hypothetical protein
VWDIKNSHKILAEKVSIKLLSSIIFFYCLTDCTAQHVLAITGHLQGQPILKEALPDDLTKLSISNVL